MSEILTTISNETIRRFNPCYDPSELGIPEDDELPVAEWVKKYRNTVKSQADIVWLLCHNEFLSDKDLRLFSVWCAREALKLVNNPDVRSVDACNVAERYANGEASCEELEAAESAARSAAESAAWSAAESASWSAAWSASWSAARSVQVDKLLTYFDK